MDSESHHSFDDRPVDSETKSDLQNEAIISYYLCMKLCTSLTSASLWCSCNITYKCVYLKARSSKLIAVFQGIIASLFHFLLWSRDHKGSKGNSSAVKGMRGALMFNISHRARLICFPLPKPL